MTPPGLNRNAMNTSLLKYCFGFPVVTVLVAICSLTVSGFANPLPPIQAVRWETDLNVAMARAEREQRPLFLHFVGNDGPSAQQMMNEVFVQTNIAAHLNANYVMVRVNAVENQALAQRFTITAIPTDLIMRPNGQIIHRRIGVITADRFAEFLTYLQNTMQSERNQASVPASPPTATAGPFPAMNSQGSSFQSPSPVAQPQQEAFATTSRDPFVQQSPVGQNPLATQQSFAQHLQGGTIPTAISSANNPLRGAETVVRPTLGQNAQNAPSTIAALQAMLDAPPPQKKTIEVPLALEGFCPIILCTEERWVSGNPAYCILYQGQIFRFSSMEALTTFAKNPAVYIPVAMGEDMVLKVDRNRRVNGDRRFGAWYQGRVFLFSSQETFNAFEARPEYYADIALKYETARREQPVPIVY